MPSLSGRTSPWFLLLGLAALSSGCGLEPAVRYLVAVSPSNPRSIVVSVECEGVPRDSLVLSGFESTDVLRVSDLEALDASGTARSILATTGTLQTEARKISVPRYVIRGPLS